MSIKTEELKKIEKEEILIWVCSDCGTIINSLKEPEECSCGYNDWYRDSQFEGLIKRAKKTQTIELCKKFEDEVKEKVEKLRELISNVMAVGDYSTWAGLEEQTLKEVDKIFGDEE